MSASLVGSEMCIRDRASTRVALTHPDPTLTSSELSLAQVAVWADDGPDMEAEPEESVALPADSRDGLRA
eukprot:6668961-Alexandrium_andersonii.AAC.1